VKGTGVLVLLGFAAGCAFGLFFGWLLHRERVERALYEDVVRTRDRATATLAETSARLELASRDMVRLRGQLTNAQHLLAERDATISELADELAELEARGHLGEPSAGEPTDAAADAATTPDDVRLIADAEPDEADITEEVALVAEVAAGDTTDDTDDEEAHARPDVAGADEEAGPVGVVEQAPAVDVERAAAAGMEPPSDVEPAPAVDVERVAAADIEPPSDVEPEPADATVTGEERATDAEIGTPLVLKADVTPEPVVTSDELQRISGVGPALERQLHAEGITTYRQLALLDDRAIADLEARRPRLAMRLRRGGWVAQARRLHVESYGTQP
jgi:predicted flap endonuclease-1-like 5' DNA nuclease